MPSSLIATVAALTGESITSLYPILIKRVDTDLLTQTTVRFAVYPVIALLLGGFGALAKTWGSPAQALAGLAFGLMNLLHVFSSYVAFEELQAGIAMSIFYLYPFLNLLGSRLYFGEAIHAWMMPFFAVALIGTYLIASVADKAKTYEHEGQPTRNIKRGLVAAFIAALTESGIYLAVRGSVTADPFANQLLLYLGGTAILAAALAGPQGRRPQPGFARPDSQQTHPFQFPNRICGRVADVLVGALFAGLRVLYYSLRGGCGGLRVGPLVRRRDASSDCYYGCGVGPRGRWRAACIGPNGGCTLECSMTEKTTGGQGWSIRYF